MVAPVHHLNSTLMIKTKTTKEKSCSGQKMKHELRRCLEPHKESISTFQNTLALLKHKQTKTSLVFTAIKMSYLCLNSNEGLLVLGSTTRRRWWDNIENGQLCIYLYWILDSFWAILIDLIHFFFHFLFNFLIEEMLSTHSLWFGYYPIPPIIL